MSASLPGVGGGAALVLVFSHDRLTPPSSSSGRAPVTGRRVIDSDSADHIVTTRNYKRNVPTPRV